MSAGRVGTTLIRPRGRFLRSAQLERDFFDAEALAGYVMTPSAVEFLNRIQRATRRESGDRSFRVLGHYGSGKSTFALLLAHWLGNTRSSLPPALVTEMHRAGVPKCEGPTLSPLLATCSREAMASALRRAVANAIARHGEEVPRKLKTLARREDLNDEDAIALLNECRDSAAQKGEGVLLVVDEAGKLLEYAALHPGKTDVYLWQQLSEAVAGSLCRDLPFVMVSIFHQGFAAYSSELGIGSRREWDKVASRYAELNFHYGLEQSLLMLNSALNVDVDSLDEKAARNLDGHMADAIEMGWYGAPGNPVTLRSCARGLYPISPFVIPPLVRLLGRYGQNERSIFSFLFGGEPHGPLDLLGKQGGLFRLDHLYDYLRANYDHVIIASSESSRWLMIKNLVNVVCGEDAVTDSLVKAIGVLNLLNADDLLPSLALLVAAFSADYTEKGVRRCVQHLSSSEGKRVLYDRGSVGGLSLWSHVSVDLNAAYARAGIQVGPVVDCVPGIVRHLGPQRLVARRHYVKTGTLRHFAVTYRSFAEFDAMRKAVIGPADDGLLVVPLCTSLDEAKRARMKAQSLGADPRVIVAVPCEPVTTVAPLLREALVWENLALNTPELSGDPYAQETVSVKVEDARRQLTEAVHRVAGLGQQTEVAALDIFVGGRPIDEPVSTKRDLTAFLSTVFDRAFHASPQVHNELLNRSKLTSAGAAAQMRLIEGILERPAEECLGMDSTRRPPEMSMYLSLLEEGGLHVAQEDGSWAIALPKGDPLSIKPALEAIEKTLAASLDARVPVTELLEAMADRPLGIRPGVAYVLLAVFTVLHDRDVAVYEDGRFLTETTGAEFQRMLKRPDTFEMQLCRIDGVRAEVYSRLVGSLDMPKPASELDLLDVVRPLCVFAAQLPPYVTKTKRLSPEATAVRNALLSAREPVVLLFRDLPDACGLDPIAPEGCNEQMAETFVAALRVAIDELRTSYYDLRQRVLSELRSAFGLDGVEDWRQDVRDRAKAQVELLSEQRLRAFAFRLADSALGDEAWGESVAALLASRPPQEWSDREENTFRFELGQCVARFKRAEEAGFGASGGTDAEAVRLCVTQADGNEVSCVVTRRGVSDSTQREIRDLLTDIIRRNGQDSLAVLYDVLTENVQ